MERKSRDVFEGKALIDRLLVYFAKFEGSREKARKYAQKLLDLGHIESLSKSLSFEDSDLKYQWTDVARVVKNAKSKLVENNCDAADRAMQQIKKGDGLKQTQPRKPIVRISIETDSCEGAEIRAHIRAGPISPSNENKATGGLTNNGHEFSLAEVQNGKMISFITETSTTEEVLRLVPVCSTVEKFEKLGANDDQTPKRPSLLAREEIQSNNKDARPQNRSDVENMNVGNANGSSQTRATPFITTSPGKGETSSRSNNSSVDKSGNAVEDTQLVLESQNECNSSLVPRPKSAPGIFSEEKYLREVKSKPIPVVSKSRKPLSPKEGELATQSHDRLSENIEIDNQDYNNVNDRTNSEGKTDLLEDKTLLKLRQEYLASQDIRDATGYSSDNHHAATMFDGSEASFLHASCLAQAIEEDPEMEDQEMKELYRGENTEPKLLTLPKQPLITISPPPPSPASPVKPPDLGLKSLFWTKISCKSETPTEQDGIFWLNTDQDVKFDQEEFVRLFSKPPQTSPNRQVATHKARQEESASGSKTLKVLGAERSRQIGIRASSFRILPEDIHDAIMIMDDTELDFDALEALYDVRPTSDELDDIADALKKYPDGILDKPEQFVLMMAMIGNLDERLKSWIFMKKFPDRVLDFKEQLKTMSNVCVEIVKNRTLQRLFEATLVFGNFLNKGTQRGDADGFHLDILPKVKDVKSQGGDSNLMLYLVRWIIAENKKSESTDLMQRRNSEGSTVSLSLEEEDCGLPDHTRLLKACATSLQDIREGVDDLSSELSECKEQLIPAVIEGAACLSEVKPFNEQMKDFVEKAERAIGDLKKLADETTEVTEEFKRYYIPFEGQSDSCVNMLKYICTFCEDFRFYWEDEKRCTAKEAFFNTEKARRQRIAAVKIAKSPSALKARFLQKRRRERGTEDTAAPAMTNHQSTEAFTRRPTTMKTNDEARMQDPRISSYERVSTPAIRSVRIIGESVETQQNAPTLNGGSASRSGPSRAGNMSKMKQAMEKRRTMLKSKTS